VLAEDAIRDLVARARRGAPDAFDALVRAHLRPAYTVALAIVGRPADAEDVAQDALVLAFERLDSLRDPGRFVPWLLSIVRNQARNWLDHRRLADVPRDSEVPETGAPDPGHDAATHRRALLHALGDLSDVPREVVLLHDLEGWTHREIGDALGISEIMSRQHLFVARQNLRERLEGELQSGVVS
jgi:RNA polymerase sigma-70 factor (ECF subfamily)